MRETTFGTPIVEGPDGANSVELSLRQRTAHRGPFDDFFCNRYEVWYPSTDCAFRTKFHTSPGCLNCEQGRFNLKRHAVSLRSARFAPPEE